MIVEFRIVIDRSALSGEFPESTVYCGHTLTSAVAALGFTTTSSCCCGWVRKELENVRGNLEAV